MFQQEKVHQVVVVETQVVKTSTNIVSWWFRPASAATVTTEISAANPAPTSLNTAAVTKVTRNHGNLQHRVLVTELIPQCVTNLNTQSSHHLSEVKRSKLWADAATWISRQAWPGVVLYVGRLCARGKLSAAHLTLSPFPANTKHLYNVCTMLAQRGRRWADVLQM